MQIDKSGRHDQAPRIELLVGAPRILLGAATSATRPSRSSTSIGALIFAAGSISVAALDQQALVFRACHRTTALSS